MDTTVAAYFRVSTDLQAEKNGTDSQEHALRAYIKAQGLGDVRWFPEEGGVSGRRLNGRAKFQEMLAGIAAGEIKTVLSYSFSRMFRSVHDAAEYIKLTIDRDVRTVCVSDGFSIDPKSPFSRAMAHMAAVFAELAADVASANSSAGIRARIARGEKWGGGRRVDPGRHGFRKLTDEQVAEIVKIEGRSNLQISRDYGVCYETIRRVRAKYRRATSS